MFGRRQRRALGRRGGGEKEGREEERRRGGRRREGGEGGGEKKGREGERSGEGAGQRVCGESNDEWVARHSSNCPKLMMAAEQEDGTAGDEKTTEKPKKGNRGDG